MWPAWGYTAEAAAAASPLPLVLRCLAQVLATGFHRFLARFSGRRRLEYRYYRKYPPPWALLVVVLVSTSLSIVDACSSRTTPKPRPPAPTPRPNITFHTYECPPAYAKWYCLNGATCFTVKIENSLLYNCECAEGYMGPRCEYKDLDGSYLPSQRRFLLNTASIAGGATIAVFLVVILCVVVYLHYKRRTKSSRSTSDDCVDSPSSNNHNNHHRNHHHHNHHHHHHHHTPIFGTRWRTCPSPDLSTTGTSATTTATAAAAAAAADYQTQQQQQHQPPLDRGDSKNNRWDCVRVQRYPVEVNRDVCSA